MLSNKLVYILMMLSLVGVADASYITANHYTGLDLACSIIKGCDVVLATKYAKIFGVPTSVYGIAYYATLFGLVYYYWMAGNKKALKLFSLVLWVGVIMTTYFIYLQLFVIHSICQYCMLSALTTIILLVIWSIYIRPILKNETK